MYRSYFFALLACAVFSVAALVNAYHNLMPVSAVQVPRETIAERQGYPNRGSGAREALDRVSLNKSDTATLVDTLPKKDGGAENLSLSQEDSYRTLEGAEGSHRTSAYSVSPAADHIGAKEPAETTFSLASNDGSKPGRLPSAASSNPEAKGNVPLNAQTDNFNILLLGTNGGKLEMVCVYSINHHLTTELKSVSLFFPVNSVFIYKGRKKTLEEIYSDRGWQAVADAVGRKMYIDINHYVKIDRQALRDLENYFEPIYVDGKKVEMETLFVRRTSNEDDRIIARILKQVLRPQVFFRYIPSLVFGVRGDIESNFSFTPKSLAEYYRIAKRLSTKRVEKVVLSGSTAWHNGQKVNIPPEDVLGSAIYKATVGDLVLRQEL